MQIWLFKSSLDGVVEKKKTILAKKGKKRILFFQN